MRILFSALIALLCLETELDASTGTGASARLSGITAHEEEEAAQDSTATEEEDEEEDEEEEDEDEDKGPDFDEVVEDFDKIEGLFDLYRDEAENKVYLAIRPEQLDKIYLGNVTRTQGDGFFFDSASLVHPWGRGWGTFPFVFEKVGKKIFFKHKNVYFRADEDAAIHHAVDRGVSDSILGTAAIEGEPHPETGAVLVDPTSLFVQDIALVGFIFSEHIKDVTYKFDSDDSYFGALSNFSGNTEIDVVLHFKTDAPKVNAYTLPDLRSFQHTYHYSLCQLPESDFKPRLADDRVGYFTTSYQDYTSALRENPYVHNINRWKLVKAEPKFKQSPPRKPIVFWLENSIPVEYRESVKQGVLLWNTAFERVGFKEAIQVKDQPDDPDWDAADVRYSTIRWMVNPGRAYAVGPSRTNPFTGEIFDADIRISADMIRYSYLQFEEYADPASQTAIGDSIAATLGLGFNHSAGYCDMAAGLIQEAAFGWHVLEARSSGTALEKDAEQYLHQFIVELTAHEVGHTLGLRHNFKASTIHSTTQLHDTEVSAREGLSSSVMDYNPVNIAPPGVEQGEYYQTALGAYDHWAIEYGYRPLKADDPHSEHAQLNKIASKVANPDLPYGTDEDAFWSTRAIDPTAARWDLGDDSIEYYRNLVAVSSELWGNIESEFETKGGRYQKLRRVFGWGFRPYRTGGANVARYIGGIYHNRDHIGDPGGRMPLVPVPAARQREALEFLIEHVFGPDAFGWSPQLLNKLAPERDWDFTDQIWSVKRIDFPIHDYVLAIQRAPLVRLYDATLLGRLQDLELRYESENPFTMPELFTNLRLAIWSELSAGTSINGFRRNLQREHLMHLIRLALKPGAAPEDARSLARADLQRLAAAIEPLLGRTDLDGYTNAHLAEVKTRIEAALTAEVVRRL